MSDDLRQARAAARRASPEKFPVRIYELGKEPLFDERTSPEVNVRVAEALRLSYEAFQLSGQPWPSYARAEMPGNVVRR